MSVKTENETGVTIKCAKRLANMSKACPTKVIEIAETQGGHFWHDRSTEMPVATKEPLTLLGEDVFDAGE